ADIKLFVGTPQQPSIHNAYALLKACIHRVIRKHATDDTGQALVDAALGHEMKAPAVGQLVDVRPPLDPALPVLTDDGVARFAAGPIGSRLAGDRDLSVLQRIATMMHEQLRVSVRVFAAIRRAPALGGGLKAGVGTIVERSDPAHAVFRALAARILEIDLKQL